MHIYLACAENPDAFDVLEAFAYPYRLCSYYALRDSEVFARRVATATGPGHASWIMDSGLFSFMFGAAQGQLKTFEDYRAYAEKYVEAMHAWGWKDWIVECDVQRVLGVDEALRLREQVFEKCGLPVIYVWHIPETEAGLERMAKRYERIALSVPELRQVLANGSISGGRSVKRAVLHLLGVARRGSARVHLLGNSENALMDAPADSCDSSSWFSAARDGIGTTYVDGRVRYISAHSPRWAEWVREVQRIHPVPWVSLTGKAARPAQLRRYEALAASTAAFALKNAALEIRKGGL